MKLLEFEAKRLLKKSSIPIPNGNVVERNSDFSRIKTPVVLKSQVPTGGRGKLGGVKIVRDKSDLLPILRQLFDLEIRGFRPNKLLAEELLDINREFYLSLIIDRDDAKIELLANKNGGIEIEDQSSEEFFRRELSPENFNNTADELADYLDVIEQTFVLEDIIKNLYRCFIDNDCLLLEINPLVLTRDKKFVAGDAKITLDDSAIFRHKDWTFDQKPSDSNFVTLSEKGTIATVANGAGLAMATVDAVERAGFSVANFLDIGGSATTEKIVECFAKINDFPNTSAVIINIFGGIVRCDDVARAIIDAKRQFAELPKLYIRLSGNHAAEARKLLTSENLGLYENLQSVLKDLS